MPKYLIQGNYTEKGLDGLLKKGGSKRREALEKAARSLGGTLEAFYFAFGDTDVFAILDLPDNVSATAFSLLVNAAAGARVKTTVLVTPAEVDAAGKKPLEYQPPGQ